MSKPKSNEPQKFFPGSAPELAELSKRRVEAARLQREGRKVEARLISRETSERRFNGVQIVVAEFDIVDDGKTRRVEYEHVFGPATARRWGPGRAIEAWVDPTDPENLYIGR